MYCGLSCSNVTYSPGLIFSDIVSSRRPFEQSGVGALPTGAHVGVSRRRDVIHIQPPAQLSWERRLASQSKSRRRRRTTTTTNTSSRRSANMTTTLTTPSPTLSPQPSFRAAARPLTTTLQLRRPLSPAVIAAAQSAAPGATSLSTSLIELTVPASASSPHQVDVGTQYSPPGYPPTAPWPTSSTEQPSPPTARRAHRDRPMNKRREPEEVKEPPKPSLRLDPSSLSPGPAVSPALPADSSAAGASQSKRPRPNAPMAKELPHTYADCDVADLGVLIADMLMDLVDINDKIPLVNGSLTRFHSR